MDPALFQRMQDAARRFRAGESDREEIMTPNGLAILKRDPSDPRGFRIDFVGEGAKHSLSLQEYPAFPTRPPGYPAPFPFLENVRCSVDTLDQKVTWRDVENGAHAFDHLCQQIEADGWVPTREEGRRLPMAGPTTRTFEKEAVMRTVVLITDDGPARIELREERRRPKA
jgi:hypothetical protein